MYIVETFGTDWKGNSSQKTKTKLTRVSGPLAVTRKESGWRKTLTEEIAEQNGKQSIVVSKIHAQVRHLKSFRRLLRIRSLYGLGANAGAG